VYSRLGQQNFFCNGFFGMAQSERTYKTKQGTLTIALFLHLALFALFGFKAKNVNEMNFFSVKLISLSSVKSEQSAPQKNIEASIKAINNNKNNDISLLQQANNNAQQEQKNYQDDSSLVSYQIGSANNPAPIYPEIARQNGWEGISKICLQVNQSGLVESAQICQTSGYAMLDSVALKTVKKWKFIIPSNIKNQYNFSIKINFLLN